MSDIKDEILSGLKRTGIGAGIGGVLGAGLGAYAGGEIDPSEIDLSDVNPNDVETWNSLTPEQQQMALIAGGGYVGGISGATLGGGLGGAYALGRFGHNKIKKKKDDDVIDAEIIKESSMYLNENAARSIIQILEEAEKKSNIDIKHPGEFTAWCKKQGFEKVNCECIKKGLASKDSHVRKMANFARNFGHPECK